MLPQTPKKSAIIAPTTPQLRLSTQCPKTLASAGRLKPLLASSVIRTNTQNPHLLKNGQTDRVPSVRPSVNGSLPKRHPALLNMISEQRLDAASAHNPFRFLKMGQVLATCHYTKVRISKDNDRGQLATILRITKI